MLPGIPYRLFRLTLPSENVRPVGMSYWPNINYHQGRSEFLVYVAIDDVIHVFSVNKGDGGISLRARLPWTSTGEGVAWALRDPDVLYVPTWQGIYAYNVATGASSALLEIASGLKQAHASVDAQVWSFTLNGQPAVFRNGNVQSFPASDYDECQVDKSGRWLLIKAGADNLVKDLETGSEWSILDKDGAVGHSDMGFGYVVGEDDQVDPGGCFRLWTFTPTGPVKGMVLYCTGDWRPLTRYVSHCCAAPGDVNGQRLLFSNHESGLTLVTPGNAPVSICPSLTQIFGAAGSDQAYWEMTRANLCPVGNYACFSGNHGNAGNTDIFVVELP
jgi:hypothetical protein